MEQGSLKPSLQETLAVFDGSGEPQTTPEVAERLDLGRRTAYARLERLAEAGHLRTKKVGANARVWWRPRPEESAVDAADPDPESTDLTARQEREFRWLVEATEEYAIFLLDADGYVETWNPGAERIKGYAESEIVGEHFSTFYTDEDRAKGVPQRNLRTAAETGSAQDEGWRVRADGSRFWANVTITALRDEDGELEGFAKVTRDMTERRAYEERLREEKNFVESLLDTQPDVLYAFDADAKLIRWNDRLAEVTGYTDAELEVMDAAAFVPERAVEKTRDAIERIFENGERVTVELPLVTADGEEIPYEFTGGPITDESGEITGFTGVGRDISERKARQRQLERQRDELQAELDDVFTRIDEAFFALDDEWRITYVNDSAAELVEMPPRELLQARVWDVLPEVAEGFPREMAERAMETQESVEFEFHSEILDIWVEVRGYPSETGMSVYVRDITQRKERERELELYETIVDTVSDGIYVLDDDFRFVKVNDAYVEMTGYDREELLGSPSTLVIDEDVAERSRAMTEEMNRVNDGTGILEADLQRADGSALRAESRFTTIQSDGNKFQKVGVVRDVSERVARERELETRVRQQEVVTQLGQRALEEPDIDALMAEAAELVADTLDNDYCKVLDLDPEAEELLLRQGVGWDEGIVGEATVSSVERDSQAAYTLETDGPVIVDDLTTETRFDGPDLLRDHDVKSGISTIIGSVDEPWGILGTHDREAKEFSENDANFVQTVANILATAISRNEYEGELIRQREQLQALNSINEVVRDITDAVIEQSTREEIEQTVCDRLAGTDSYMFAWVGEIDSTTRTVNLTAEAGVEGYLDDVTISVDPDDELSRGPTGQAFITGEMQVVNDIHRDSAHDPWREDVEQYDFRSSAAIPIAHQGTVYGTLNIYAGRPNAFTGQEREVLSQLGEVIGHAIAAANQKQALMSDELVELDFQIQDVFGSLDIPVETDGRITLGDTVPVGDGVYLVYGNATPDAVETVKAVVDAVPHWESVTFRSEDDPTSFELRLSDPPVLSVVASLGGYVESAVIEGGDYRMRIHLAPTADVRQVIDAVKEAYPQAEMLRRRQIERTRDGPQRLQRRLETDLTDRQRTALAAAYHAGFFEWPRDATGEEVAESMGVAPPTFHQHLRKAEQKVLDILFATSEGSPV